MIIGHTLAYTPAVAMWGPSYIAEKWLYLYKKTLEYAKKMHWYAGIGTITFLAADLIYTTETGQRARRENGFVTMLIYCELQILVWWAIPYYKLD